MPSNRIGTVCDVPGQAWRTAEEYRRGQAAAIDFRRENIRGLQSLHVYEIDAPIEAYVTRGIWRVRCVCGEAPSTHPQWRLACCAGCGAVFTNVLFPSAEQQAEIETVLLKRKRERDRNWLSAWTLEHLRAQNVAHGEEDPFAVAIGEQK